MSLSFAAAALDVLLARAVLESSQWWCGRESWQARQLRYLLGPVLLARAVLESSQWWCRHERWQARQLRYLAGPDSGL